MTYQISSIILLAAIAGYMYHRYVNRFRREGYRIGKAASKNIGARVLADFMKSGMSAAQSVKATVESITDTFLGRRLADLTDKARGLEAQIDGLKKEKEAIVSKTPNVAVPTAQQPISYDERIATLKEELASLNRTKAILEERLHAKLDEKVRADKNARERAAGIVSEEAGDQVASDSGVDETHAEWRSSVKAFWTDVIKYAVLAVVIVLWVADYAILYGLLKEYFDFFATSAGGDVGVWSLRAMTAAFFLVPLVCFHLLMPVVDKGKSVGHRLLQTLFYGAIGLLTVAGLALLVYFRVSESASQRFLHLALALLTFPMAALAAILLHKLGERDGGFAFVLSPLKIVALPVLMALQGALHALRNLTRRMFKASELRRKLRGSNNDPRALGLASDISAIKTHIAQVKDDQHKTLQAIEMARHQQTNHQLAVLKAQGRVTRVVGDMSRLLAPLDERIAKHEASKRKIEKAAKDLRAGCEKGIIDHLKLPAKIVS